MPQDETYTSVIIGLVLLKDLERFDKAIDAAYGKSNMRSQALRAFIRAIGNGRLIIKPEQTINEPEFQVLTPDGGKSK